MKPFNCLLAGTIALCLSVASYAQDLQIPDLPETKEQFASTEKFIIDAAKWLETNPIDKNSELLVMFMAGYARYVLENNQSKDQLKANTAGVKSAINPYNLGGDIKKDKYLQKIVEADKSNTLEA